MVGTTQVKVMAEFYEKVINRKPDMSDESMSGWQVGGTFLGIGEHSEVKGMNKEPARFIMNFETKELKEEFERIKAAGATVIKEPYEMGNNMWIATFADPDENYFQLMTPWEGNQ